MVESVTITIECDPFISFPLTDFIALVKDNITSCNVYEASRVINFPVVAREGDESQVLGSQNRVFQITFEMKTNIINNVYDLLILGTLFFLRLIKHDQKWFDVPATLMWVSEMKPNVGGEGNFSECTVLFIEDIETYEYVPLFIDAIPFTFDPFTQAIEVDSSVRSFTPWLDDFDDDIMDAKWEEHTNSTATVAENNSRLEITMGAPANDTWRSAGFVSASAYDIKGKYVEVDITAFDSFARMGLVICLTKNTASFFKNEDDLWLVAKDNDLNRWYVRRRKNGSEDVTEYGNWEASTGILKIFLHCAGTKIDLYEGLTRKVYSGTYGLSSTTVYVMLVGYTYDKTESGMDHMDDFASLLEL